MHVVKHPYGSELPNRLLRVELILAALVALIPFAVVIIAGRNGIDGDDMDKVVIPLAALVFVFPMLVAKLTPRRRAEEMPMAHDDPIAASKWPYVMVGSIALLAITLAIIIWGGFAFIINQ